MLSVKNTVLYGIGGVGKTAVAVKLVDEVKDNFEFAYWRSLSTASSLPISRRSSSYIQR